jgi:hypothetical protein
VHELRTSLGSIKRSCVVLSDANQLYGLRMVAALKPLPLLQWYVCVTSTA